MRARLLLMGRVVFFLATVAISGWSSYRVIHFLRTAPPFEVKALVVTGVNGPLKRVSEPQVVGQAEFELGSNVFQVDLNAMRERVERLQWVRHAIVQRVLPDQIIIKVVEREPIGLGRLRGEIYQFDEDAAILDLDSTTNASFPVLDGLRRNSPEGNLKKVALYRKVIEELGQTELSEIHVNDAEEVSVVSASDPLVVNLGTSEFRTRWVRYLQLKTQIQQRYPEAMKIDLRFKNQVIVSMKDDENANEQVIWDGAKKSL